MSKRITTQTEIKDKALAESALKKAGYTYRSDGDSIFITSGPMANSTLNLKTGSVQGDSDFGHSTESLGLLRQHYAEAKYTREVGKQGGLIESRNVTRNGDIELMIQIG